MPSVPHPLQVSVTMKSHSFFPAVTVLVILLTIAVEKVHLVSPVGRRFGRSLTKKHSFGRTGQAHFFDEQTDPLTSKDKKEAAQYFHQSPLVRKYKGGSFF